MADVVRLAALTSAGLAVVWYPLTDAVRFVVVFGVLLGVRFLRPPGLFDLAFCLTSVVATWATVAGWYADARWLDVAVHGLTAGATAVVLLFLLARLGVLPPLATVAMERPLASPMVLTTMFALAAGALWEMYEYVAERVLGMRMLVGYSDTVADLLMDGLGGLLAGAALSRWLRRQTGC